MHRLRADLVFDFQISLSRNRQTCRIGVWIKSHIIMRLAHPRQGCVIVNFNRIAPRISSGTAFFDFAKSISVKAFAVIDQLIDFALEGCFQKVRDEVVIVGVRQHLCQGETLHPLV